MDAPCLLAPFAVGYGVARGDAYDGVDGYKPFSVVPLEPQVHETVERAAADSRKRFADQGFQRPVGRDLGG